MHKLADSIDPADIMDKPKKKRAAAQLKDEITAYKRRRILEEASHFFFANGYEATTLDSVAEQLNVTKPFIYSYYKNKGELLYEICQTGIQLSLTALEEALSVEGTASEQLKIVVERVARIIIENQRYVTVYLREEKCLQPEDARRIRELRHAFDTKLAALLEKGKRTGEFDVAHPSRTAIWVSGLLSWIALWYHEGGRWSATEVVMDAITMVQKMVQPAGGAKHG